MGHFQGDAEVYRSKAEVPSLRQNDPIRVLETFMRGQGALDDAAVERLRTRAQAQVTTAFEYARASAYPAAEEALQHVFA